MIHAKILELNSSGFDDLCNFRGELFHQWLTTWNALGVTVKDPYTHPVWVMSFLKSRYENEKQKENLANILKLFILFSDNTFIGIVPLYIDRKPLLPGKLGLLKSPTMLFSSSLALDKKYYKDIARHLFLYNNDIAFKPLSLCFYFIDETNEFLNASINKLKYKEYKRAYLDFSDGYENIVKNLKSGFRRDLRSFTKKLSSQGKLYLEIVDTAPDIFDAYNDLINLESCGWKGTTEYALKNNDFSRMFFHTLLKGFSVFEKAVILNLRLDNELIASILAVIINDMMYSIKVIYNENYSKFSPGHILHDFIFKEYFIQNGIKIMNCISSAEWFQNKWRTNTLDVYKMIVFPDNPAGNLLKTMYSVYHILNK